MNKPDLSDFAKTVTDAVAVIDHVWSQVAAMKARLDKDFASALQSVGFIAEADDDYEDGESNKTEDVTIAWLWGYHLRKKSGRRGRQPHLGRLYVLVRIAPSPGKEDADSFVPYVSVHVDHKECGACDIAEFDSLLEYKEDWEEFDRAIFPTATLCCAACLDESNDDGRSAAAFLPLETIDHKNLERSLVHPTAKLVKFCMDKWFPFQDDGD